MGGDMILTDEDIEGISLSVVSVKDAKADARAVEAAVLAKLAWMELPNAEFSSWHGEDYKTLLNPNGVCNAFNHPPRIPEDKYWTDKGYHGEPLYTAQQLNQAYAQGAASQLCKK